MHCQDDDGCQTSENGFFASLLYTGAPSLVSCIMSDLAFLGGMCEYVICMEFQCRGTLHVHMALWALPWSDVNSCGTTGKPHNSPLIRFLSQHGFDTVDVQYGEGFINYINGYTTKASDALDFRFKEHLNQDNSSKWRLAYRLLCKNAPCIPEVYGYFASLAYMKRSFYHDTLYAPIQRRDMDLSQNNVRRRSVY